MSYKSCKPVFRREAVLPVCVNETSDDSLYWISLDFSHTEHFYRGNLLPE